MFKLVVLSVLIAIATARPSAEIISAPISYLAEAPTASGYAYSASVHTPDYVNHQSVSQPLGSTTVIKSLPAVATYSAPLTSYGYGYSALPYHAIAHAW